MYLLPPCEWETLLGDPQRAVAPGEGLGQNPRSRRPAPVCGRKVHKNIIVKKPKNLNFILSHLILL